MIAENNPFASQHHQQQQHQPPVGNGIPSGGHPPLSRNLPGSNFSSSTSNVTRSSDDLLQEYGIDFSKLSASPAAAAGGSSNGLNSPSPSGGALLRPTSVKPAVAPKPASLGRTAPAHSIVEGELNIFISYFFLRPLRRLGSARVLQAGSFPAASFNVRSSGGAAEDEAAAAANSTAAKRLDDVRVNCCFLYA